MASPNNSGGLVRTSASPSSNSVHQDIVSTPEIQRWMSSIEQLLNEVCAVSAESKMNAEQKLRISNLCRKIGHGTSQMAVTYQSLKQKALHASTTIETLEERCNLTEHLSGLERTIKETTVQKSSYAEMIKKGTNSFIRPNNLSAVAIYPRDILTTSDQTKNLVQKTISPEEMKLQVRGIRKTINGGVIISTETKADAEKLKQAVQRSIVGFSTDEPSKRKPRIVIIGVPSSLPDNEVLKCLFEQNITEKIPSMTPESYSASVKISHKSGKKDAASCNYIIEVSANIRKALINQTRVFINWTSCPVRDFTLVTRCYKCHQYGHAAKSCRDINPTCGHCGVVGHAMAECSMKSEMPKCATCSRFKKPNNHNTGDADCPARKQAEYRYINSIDYEGTSSA